MLKIQLLTLTALVLFLPTIIESCHVPPPPPPTPQPPKIILQVIPTIEKTIEVGKTVIIRAKVTPFPATDLKWTVIPTKLYALNTNTGEQVIYKAPDAVGEVVVVAVNGTVNGVPAEEQVVFSIVASTSSTATASPTQTESATATFTPVSPTATFTVVPPSSTPTATETHTPVLPSDTPTVTNTPTKTSPPPPAPCNKETVHRFSSDQGAAPQQFTLRLRRSCFRPGKNVILLENANPAYSGYWAVWDYLSLRDISGNFIWEVGRKDAPPIYDASAFSEFKQDSPYNAQYQVGAPVSQFPKELNDGVVPQIFISFNLTPAQTQGDLVLFLSTLYTTHTSDNKQIPYFDMKITVNPLP